MGNEKISCPYCFDTGYISKAKGFGFFSYIKNSILFSIIFCIIGILAIYITVGMAFFLITLFIATLMFLVDKLGFIDLFALLPNSKLKKISCTYCNKLN